MYQDLLFAVPKILSGSYTAFLKPFFDKAELERIQAWEEGNLNSQPLASILESHFGEGSYVSLFASGRQAIKYALRALELPEKSEVILPTFCCGSVPEAVKAAGHLPVLSDVDLHFNLSLQGVEAVSSPATKVVIVPHLSGLWNNSLEKIIDWARPKGIYVIEDCAQSLGLKRQGMAAGMYGDIGIFSTGLGKIAFTPGGGWAVTRNKALHERLSSVHFSVEPKEATRRRIHTFLHRFACDGGDLGLRTLQYFFQSQLRRFSKVPSKAIEFGLSDIEKDLIALQLKKLDTVVSKRDENAQRWTQLIEQRQFHSIRILPQTHNVHSKYLVTFGQEAEGKRWRKQLSKSGLAVEDSYTPLHLRPAYAVHRRGTYPITEAIAKTTFALPVRPNLNEQDWKRIYHSLRFN